jgi:aminoglycoside phosphotransferase family enzyme
MSWLFLAGDYAYKLKKPVKLEFLDFSTLAARKRNCQAEIRLNRRLAPGIYLDVVPLSLTQDGGLALAGDGAVVDWLVKMRRLDRRRMLDHAIAAGNVDAALVRPAGELLARFFHGAAAVAIEPAAYRRRFAVDIDADRGELLRPEFELPAEPVEALAESQRRFLSQHTALIEGRARAGRVIEGHGDLRPEHVFLGPPPAVIDCLEFNLGFRLLDPLDELAYLDLECARLGAPALGAVFFASYANFTGDQPPARLVAFYACHRALLRAKIAIWHLREPDLAEPERWRRRALEYLALGHKRAKALD